MNLIWFYFIFAEFIVVLKSRNIIERINLKNDTDISISTNTLLPLEHFLVDVELFAKENYISCNFSFIMNNDEECKMGNIVVVEIYIKNFGFYHYSFCGKDQLKIKSWEKLKVKFDGDVTKFENKLDLNCRKRLNVITFEGSRHNLNNTNIIKDILTVIFIILIFQIIINFIYILYKKKMTSSITSWRNP